MLLVCGSLTGFTVVAYCWIVPSLFCFVRSLRCFIQALRSSLMVAICCLMFFILVLLEVLLFHFLVCCFVFHISLNLFLVHVLTSALFLSGSLPDVLMVFVSGNGPDESVAEEIVCCSNHSTVVFSFHMFFFFFLFPLNTACWHGHIGWRHNYDVDNCTYWRSFCGKNR